MAQMSPENNVLPITYRRETPTDHGVDFSNVSG